MAFQNAGAYVDDSLSHLKDVDWLNEIRLVTTAVILTAAIWGTGVSIHLIYSRLTRCLDLNQYVDIEALLPKFLRTPNPPLGRRIYTCGPPPITYDSTFRTIISDTEIYIYAWPSHGGVIILDNADAIDLSFLGLDPLDPPARRLPSQEAEDALCQRLLLLGAKWWSSVRRYRFLAGANEMDSRCIDALDEGREPEPTMRERRFVSVGWPSEGGLYVAEFDINLWGVQEEDNLMPDDTARLKLARTMDERCQVLRDHFGAKFYSDVREYEGHAFLNSWKEKEEAVMNNKEEVGSLIQKKQQS